MNKKLIKNSVFFSILESTQSGESIWGYSNKPTRLGHIGLKSLLAIHLKIRDRAFEITFIE